jgi:hypothetical protein
MTLLWDVAPCSLEEIDGRFRGACTLRLEGVLMMDAESASETSANFYKTTLRKIPNEGHLHTRRRENLKYHFINRVFFTSFSSNRKPLQCENAFEYALRQSTSLLQSEKVTRKSLRRVSAVVRFGGKVYWWVD